MKHISKILSRLALTGCLLAAMCGCVQDGNDYTPENDGQLVRVQIKVSGSPSTRAAAFSDTLIETIDVLSFRADGSKTYQYRATPIGIDPDSEYFDIILNKSRDEHQILVVLANLRNEVNAFTLTEGVTTLEDLQRGLTFDFKHKAEIDGAAVPDADKFGKERLIPMWGQSEPVAIVHDKMKIGTIYMLRSLAELNVVVALPGGPGDFELVDVAVYNTPNKGCAIPDPQKIDDTPKSDGTPYIRAMSATVPTSAVGYSTGKAYYTSTDGISLNETIYIGEKDNTSQGIAEGDQTWLVISGKYDGDDDPTWYRVPLKGRTDKNDPFELMDVLRNHSYLLKITSVTGRGGSEENPEIANMNAEVVAWETGMDVELTIDGNHWLWIEERQFDYTWRSATDGKFTVETNYPEAWTLVTSSSKQQVSPLTDDWITITSPAGATGNKNGVVEFSVAENSTNSTRTGYIHLKAGRMSFVFEVNQTGITFDAQPGTINLAAAGDETKTVTVTTNYTAWTFDKSEANGKIEGDPTWLIVTKTANGLDISATENIDLTKGRTAYVKVIAGEQYAWITVTQDKYGPYTIKNLNPVEIGQIGGYIRLDIYGEYWPDFRVRAIHKDNGTVIVQPQVVLSSKTPSHPKYTTLTVPPNETWEPIPLLVQYSTDGTNWMPIHEGSETRQVSHTNDTPSLPATSIWRNGETITVTIPGNYTDGYIQVRATGTGFNEISGYTNASKQVALAIPHNATGTKASDSRTVTFQYRRFVNNAWETTWRPIKDIPQIKGNVLLNETGRMVAMADYDNGQLLTWAQAMGIDEKYNYTNLAPLYTWGDDLTKLDIRYYTPTEPTGCAAYFEPDAPAGSWRLPTRPEFNEMAVRFNELEGIGDGEFVVNNAYVRYWVAREGNDFQDIAAATVAFRETGILGYPTCTKYLNPAPSGGQRMYVRCVRDK